MRALLIVMLILCFQLSLGMLNVIPIFDSYYPNQTAVLDLDNCSIDMVDSSYNITNMYISPDQNIINSTAGFNNDDYYIPVLSELSSLSGFLGTFFSFIKVSLTGVGEMLSGFGLPDEVAGGIQAGIWGVFGIALIQLVRGVGTKSMD